MTHRRDTTHSDPADSEVDSLIAQSNADPQAVIQRAEELLASDDLSPTATIRLNRVLGVALQADRRPEAAAAPLRRAVDLARAQGDRTLLGEAQLSFALTLAHSGATSEAIINVNQAVDALNGLARADARFQRGLILLLVGRLDDSLRDFHAARQGFRRAGRNDWEADLLMNRGVAYAYAGGGNRARRDFEDARRLYRLLDDAIGAASMAHNLAWLSALEGASTRAVAEYAAAEELLRDAGFPTETTAVDQCAALVDAGLFREAQARAEEAISSLRSRAMELEEAQALVILAEVCAETSAVSRGRLAVRRALDLLERHSSGAWEARARVADLRLAPDDDDRSDSDIEELVTELEQTGFHGWAEEALLLLARRQTQRGDLHDAAASLDRAARTGRGRESPLWWLRVAELRESSGRSPDSAVRAGLIRIERVQALGTTTEVQINAGHMARSFVEVATRSALRATRADRAITWWERLHAASRLPSDLTPSADLTELRAITHRLVIEETPSDQHRYLLERRRRLQRALRTGSAATADVTAGSTQTAREGTAVVFDGSGYFAIDLAPHTRRDPIPLDPRLRTALDDARFALRSGSTGLLKPEVAIAVARDALAVIDLPAPPSQPFSSALLIPPELVALPTALIDGWEQTPVVHVNTLNPRPSPGHASRTSVLIGSRLRHAQTEAQQIMANTGTAAASVDRVLRSLASDERVHVIAHGLPSIDGGSFDALSFADGPLFAHEIAALPKAPSVVLLSACDVGEGSDEHGVGRLGFVSALLAAGTWRVIASAIPLPDALATARVMSAIHRELDGGALPERALTTVQQTLTDPMEWLIAASLSCWGDPCRSTGAG